MRYRDAFAYVFRSPRWLPNLLILSIAILIPLVGAVFALGYVAVVTQSLRWGRPAEEYHTIDFDRLGDYLLRGLRMFLVSFLAGVAIVPVYFVVVFGTIVIAAITGGGAAGGGDGGGSAVGSALGCVFTAAGVALLLAAVLAVMAVLLPLYLRAALHEDIAAIFSLSYVKDFLRRMWRECLLYYLVLMAAGIVLGIGGLLALIVGVIVVAAYLHLVQAHLLAQLADLYESRGGEPVAGASSEMPTPPPLPG
jgi:hypothetical protein